MNQDMQLWADISSMQMEIMFAQEGGEELTLAKTCYQLFYKLTENIGEEMAVRIDWNVNLTDAEFSDPTTTILTWLEKPNAMTSPFFDEAFTATYFVTANDLLSQSSDVLASGEKSNADSDAFGLVTVIYSVVLFLLGIAGSFKGVGSRYAVLIVSAIGFVLATVYMFTIPLPAGFSVLGFFGVGG